MSFFKCFHTTFPYFTVHVQHGRLYFGYIVASFYGDQSSLLQWSTLSSFCLLHPQSFLLIVPQTKRIRLAIHETFHAPPHMNCPRCPHCPVLRRQFVVFPCLYLVSKQSQFLEVFDRLCQKRPHPALGDRGSELCIRCELAQTHNHSIRNKEAYQHIPQACRTSSSTLPYHRYKSESG